MKNQSSISITDNPMKTIGRYNFPETEAEVNTWTPDVSWQALAQKVLVVAKTRIEGKWVAYCDSVAGNDHDQEYDEVLRSGEKLPEDFARHLFPAFEGIPYAQ